MKICLLGASGSIGQQTLDVINQNPNDFTLVSFSVGNRHECIPNILKNNPKVTHVYLKDNSIRKTYEKKYPHIVFYFGNEDNINLLIKESDNEMVVNALVGFVGLVPSVTAIENHKKLALANKESLVVGGAYINKLLRKTNGQLYPIDSEHSALWKCLKVDNKNVEKLVLTASGGAFRKLSLAELSDVTPEDALKHPTWQMGNKITIDCATMVNKSFELIEAYHLFGYKGDKLGVKLHDESLLHSYVIYKSGVCRGEFNKPDMRNPIKFALYEGNIPFDTVMFASLNELKDCHFHDFDINRYPLVGYADMVIEKGGNLGAIYNAANEVAVHAFLDHKIPFLSIDKVIAESFKRVKYIKNPGLKSLILTHKRATKIALEIVEKEAK